MIVVQMSISPERPAIQRAPAPDVTMRYLLAGAVAFVVFAAGVPLLAPTLIRTNDDPHVFALTHVAVLGWITMTMMGALYQLFPVALAARATSERLARWNFWLYLVAVGGFVPSFYLDWTPGVAAFGVLAVGGIAHFASALLRSFGTVREWHPMAWYVLAGLLWLLATIGFGLMYALDWRFGWFEITDPMLAAHVHLGLAGWLSLTLMGVSYKLTAMFSLAHGHGHRLALANLGLWNAGLLGFAGSLIFVPGSPLVLAFATLLALSALLFVADMGRLLRHRRRRQISLEQWHTIVAFGALLAAASLGLVLASGHAPSRSWAVAYGWIAVAGWFGFSIVGNSYKIVPFLVWLRRYSELAGAQRVPLLRELLDPRLAWTSFGLLLLGLVGVGVGLLVGATPIVEVAGLGYLGGAGIYAGTLLRLGAPLLVAPSPGRAVSETVA